MNSILLRSEGVAVLATRGTADGLAERSGRGAKIRAPELGIIPFGGRRIRKELRLR